MKKKLFGKKPYVRPQVETFRVGSACPILAGSNPPVNPGTSIVHPEEEDEEIVGTDVSPTYTTVIEDPDFSE